MANLRIMFLLSTCILAAALVNNLRDSFEALIHSLACTFFNIHPEDHLLKQKVLLLMLDGLRWDNFGLELPNLDKVARNGVKAEWLDGVFPTLSMPSMYSIATGLYTENHGVVHNVYFDRVTKKRVFDFGDTCNITEWFDTGAEPIWVTAVLQGLHAGTIMYPGGSVPIKGVRPDKDVPFVHSLWSNLEDQIDTAISWLTTDDLDFVALFFQNPDEWLHEFGIHYEETSSKLYEIDDAIGYLFDIIQEGKLDDIVNVIIVSDHGMVDVDERKYVYLFDHMSEEDVDLMIGEYGMFFLLEPAPGKTDKVYDKLSVASPAMHIFKKNDLPERFHYGNNDRVLSIVGFVDPGWHQYTKFPLKGKITPAGHGYDNRWMSMKSVFYATGPFFRPNYTAPPLDSVDIYQLMCEILSLDPAPNNGSRAHYTDMLKRSDR